MEPFAIAVKAFIVREGKLLLLERSRDDVQKPSVWDLPGGRLESGENPFEGVKRETKEETTLDIDIKHPIGVRHFKRDDGQKITMIVFLCESASPDVEISHEHERFRWVPIDDIATTIDPFFYTSILAHYKEFFQKAI